MASDKGTWRGEKKWNLILGLHHEKPLPGTWKFRFGCKVMCVRYLAHSTRYIVSAQYIWAAIIIIQGLQRSCGWARVDGLLDNQFSVLSILYIDSRWVFFKGYVHIGSNPLSDGPWPISTPQSSHPWEACATTQKIHLGKSQVLFPTSASEALTMLDIQEVIVESTFLPIGYGHSQISE